MKWDDLIGTVKSYLRIGLAGPRLKNDSGNLAIRNAGDSADAEITAAKVKVSGDDLELNSDAANSGADRKYTLRRPSTGMGAAVTLTLPPTDGSPNQVLKTDGGGNLDWTDAGDTSAAEKMDTTTLAFGSSSPVAMFTLPANNIINQIEVVVDTPFDGTPSASVGISGQASKYVAASDIDLGAAAATVFQLHPGKPAEAGTEALIITYAAGGATVGSARIIVHYAQPA